MNIITYLCLQLGIVTLLVNPMGSLLLSTLNIIGVYLLYQKARPLIVNHIQNQKNFEKYVNIVHHNNRNMFAAKQFGSFIDSTILATPKESQSVDRSKNITAYIATDFHLSALVIAYATSPALVIYLLFF
ncbi:conserved hypothetical protein [Vibrio jasicida]|uniref:ABC transmembrane type-1 domain-containing protein n=1 Tax=Vibrio jasicida TaxID=766224 RepID=A0AAU9QQX4_9VIBR|nr:conserved hypothetical protein [Vibrio jasicida]CAH1599320.1 conserved hypothetical protein [Vibrio jasicida]